MGQSTEFAPAGKEETDFLPNTRTSPHRMPLEDQWMPPVSATLTRDIRVNYVVGLILVTDDLVEGRQPYEKSTQYLRPARLLAPPGLLPCWKIFARKISKIPSQPQTKKQETHGTSPYHARSLSLQSSRFTHHGSAIRVGPQSKIRPLGNCRNYCDRNRWTDPSLVQLAGGSLGVVLF